MSFLSALRGFPFRSAASVRWTRIACSRRNLSIVSNNNNGARAATINSSTGAAGEDWPKCSITIRRGLSSMNPNDFIAASLIDSVTFETVCSDTLESLCDYFEHLVEETSFLRAADVTYGDGVLTVNLGAPHGTYVINRQSPNRQIWLSSPTSGPKRYDFVPDKSTVNEGCWVYKHDGVSLHQLLQQEIGAIVQKEVDFLSLPHSKRVE